MHKPYTQGGQVAPSLSELPLWGNVLIEGTVSIHSHKESKVTRFITYRFQKQRRVVCIEPGVGGQSSVLCHKPAGHRE